MNRKTILIIRDGWGYRESKDKNAIAEAQTPNTDYLMQNYPNILLETSGTAVGLPENNEGNSEVGHFTIGAGRVKYGSLMRIHKSVEDGSFFEIPELNEAIENCQENNTNLHLMGLLQTEGVHSHINHLFALIDLCKKKEFSNVLIHVITDGRDAPVKDSQKHLSRLQEKLKETGIGKIATISGRYFTMDRDKRWDRTKKSYDCIINAEAESFEQPLEKVKELHANDETDEFIRPRKASWYEGVKDNDSVIFFNFRTDRPRQLTKAIVEEEFEGWQRTPLNVYYVAMTLYYTPMNAKVAFKEETINNNLGEVVAQAGKKQLRISETEKYAHVTFFFNAQQETPYQGEERILINSPKVATYDLKPGMSVYEIKEKLCNAIREDKYNLIVTNLVNGDMVGHTGIPEAVKKGIESVDKCLGEIVDTGLKHNYNLLIFADHGNAEDQTDEWRTSHTINPVPCILVSPDLKLKDNRYSLQDIAPTALDIMGIEKPSEMTGTSLIEK